MTTDVTQPITTDGHEEGIKWTQGPAATGSSRGDRPTSWDVETFPLPSGREEEWRFTPIEQLHSLLSDEPSPDLHIDYQLPSGTGHKRLSAVESRAPELLAPSDRAAVVAAAGAQGAELIEIEADAELAEPIYLTITGADGQRAQGHLVIRAGRNSKALVILEHRGKAEYSQVVSVVVDDGADLELVSLQTWDMGAIHLTEHDTTVGRDAHFKHVNVTLGGSVVRGNVNVRHAGPGGNAELVGVYLTDSGQHHEHRLFIDHAVERCYSRATYKGALQGASAHSVWIGDVLIRAAAEGTDTYELNRNLVLTRGAQADSVPNLEIETGEIEGAGHASATGRFDDEQLFYLRSRGISEDVARRLVVHGFFAELVRQIGVKDIEDRLIAAIDAQLDRKEDR